MVCFVKLINYIWSTYKNSFRIDLTAYWLKMYKNCFLHPIKYVVSSKGVHVVIWECYVYFMGNLHYGQSGWNAIQTNMNLRSICVWWNGQTCFVKRWYFRQNYQCEFVSFIETDAHGETICLYGRRRRWDERPRLH